MNKIKTQKTKKNQSVTRNGDLVNVQVKEPNFWYSQESARQWTAEDTDFLSSCYKAVTEKLSKQYGFDQLTISVKVEAYNVVLLEITTGVKQCPQLITLMKNVVMNGDNMIEVMRDVSYNDKSYIDFLTEECLNRALALESKKRHEVAS